MPPPDKILTGLTTLANEWGSLAILWLSASVIRFVHFVMQRKQLLGIAQRVEASDITMPLLSPSVDATRRSA